jgi:cytidylate kinase
MNRIEDALDILYEDEELALCCEEFLPRIEKILEGLDKSLPSFIDEDFFVEVVNQIRDKLLTGNKNYLEEKMGVVTVTFELGSGGLEVAKEIAKKIGYKLVFEEILKETAKRLGVPEWEIEDFNEFKYASSKLSFFDMFQLDKDFIDFSAILGKESSEITFEKFRETLTKTVVSFAISNNVVIVGHGAACFLREYPNCLHIKVEAPFADRVKAFAKNYNITLEEAEKQLKKIDEKEKDFYKDMCDSDISSIELFHLKINTSRIPVEKASELAVNAFKLLIGD